MSAYGRAENGHWSATNAYQLEAMINVLERKGILTSKEVMDEVEVIVETQRREEGWMDIFRGLVFRILIKATLLGAIILIALYLVDINFFKDWGNI